MANRKEIKEKENKEVQEALIEEDKTKEVQKVEKIYANFWKRLCAFLIDMFLISMVTSLVTQPFVNKENLQKLSDETYDTIEQYTKGKVDINTYINRTVDISYDMARASGLSTIIGLAISILYFVVYQFKCNGQTLGKKIMKIKIVKKDDTSLTINDILFRSLIINSILSDMVVLCFSIFASKDVYFYGAGIIQFMEYLVIFISCLLILSRKDKQGLHDMIVNTEVVIV